MQTRSHGQGLPRDWQCTPRPPLCPPQVSFTELMESASWEETDGHAREAKRSSPATNATLFPAHMPTSPVACLPAHPQAPDATPAADVGPEAVVGDDTALHEPEEEETTRPTAAACP